MANHKLLSVICPVHNEEACIQPFYERLAAALEPLAHRLDWELIFMNNRSQDRTAEEILALRDKDPRVQLVTFSRNYGYQASVLTGLRQAGGDAMVVIDVDCEDPPEMIPEFVACWEQGHDVVYGERTRRPEPRYLTFLRRAFYRVTRLVADSDIVLDMAEFSLITAPVRDAVVSARNTAPFVRAEIAHYGFSRHGIRYDRQNRIRGVTHYNLWSMTVFAVAGILSSSTLPLRMALYLLPPVLLANLVLWQLDITGLWAHSVSSMLALNLSYLCTAVAFNSLYLARTYRNTIGRPLAVIDQPRSSVNGPSTSRSSAAGLFPGPSLDSSPPPQAD